MNSWHYDLACEKQSRALIQSQINMQVAALTQFIISRGIFDREGVSVGLGPLLVTSWLTAFDDAFGIALDKFVNTS